MGVVLDTPYQVGIRLATQGSRVGKRRKILPDFLRIGIVVLELQALRFGWLLAQFEYKAVPLVGTAFLDRRHGSSKKFSKIFGKLSGTDVPNLWPKIPTSEIVFGGDLTGMASIMVGTGGFEPPTSTVSR